MFSSLKSLKSVDECKQFVEKLILDGVSLDSKDRSGDTILCVAAALPVECAVPVVELLLDKGANAGVPDARGFTPLHIACLRSNGHLVALLLRAGPVDVNGNGGVGRTTSRPPLYMAASCGNLEVVSLLLEQGALTERADKNGCTPLFPASECGHRLVVELLLDMGAVIDQAENSGATPLWAASQNGHLEVVELLLTKGAAIDHARIDGTTPLLIASQNGHLAVLNLLLAKGRAPVDQAKKKGAASFLSTAQRGIDPEALELLQIKRVAINQAAVDGWTPLISASEKGHLAVVELLLTEGAAIDQPDNKGATPLYIASQNGHLAVVEMLLAKGAAIDQAQKDGTTPLDAAKRNGHDAIFELLSKNSLKERGYGAFDDPVSSFEEETSAVPIDGYVAFGGQSSTPSKSKIDSYVSFSGFPSSSAPSKIDSYVPFGSPSSSAPPKIDSYVPFGSPSSSAPPKIDAYAPFGSPSPSLSSSPKINAYAPFGSPSPSPTSNLVQKSSSRTPTYPASPFSSSITVQDPSSLLSACASGNFIDVKAELGRLGGSFIPKEGPGGRYSLTPLHVAAERGFVDIVELLLGAGHPVDTQLEANGATPLYMACRAGQTACCRALAAGGASLTLAKDGGTTPLMVSIRCSRLECFRSLVSRLSPGEISGPCDDSGRTPLHFAAMSGRRAFFEELLRVEGFDPGAVDHAGATPLSLALVFGRTALIDFLVGEVGLERLNITAGSPPALFHTGACGGRADVARALLRAGAAPDVTDSEGRSALYVALGNGYVDVVKALLDGGADPYLAKRADGSSTLHVAAKYGRVPELCALAAAAAARGADRLAQLINCQRDDGLTPLQVAAERGKIGALHALLDLGAQAKALPAWAAEAPEERAGVLAALARRDPQGTVGGAFVQEARRAGLFRPRLCFVGPAAAGKTTLIQQLLQPEPSATPASSVPGTMGIDVHEADLEGTPVSLWDFGGQDMLRSTHSLFLSEEVQFVVVADAQRLGVSKRYQSTLRHWLHLVARFATPSTPPVLLVLSAASPSSSLSSSSNASPSALSAKFKKLTNKKKRPKAEREAADAFRELAASVLQPQFFDGQVRFADERGELRLRLACVARDELLLRRGLSPYAAPEACPFECVALRRRLARERVAAPLLRWPRFVELASECGINGEEPLARATGFLVNYGAVVTFCHLSTAAPALVVLDPLWLSRAYAALLPRDAQAALPEGEQMGLLAKDELRRRWRECGVDEGVWDDLATLFGVYQLVVPVDGDQAYFVPALLRAHCDRTEPPMTREQRAAYLRTRCPARAVYARRLRLAPALPAGFLDRLVVRLLFFPGVRLVRRPTWIDDFVLESPFGYLRVFEDGVDEQLALELHHNGGDDVELAFFASYFFQSPRALVASYFLECTVRDVVVLRDGQEVGAEPDVLRRGLLGQLPADAAPEVGLLGVRRFAESDLAVDTDKPLSSGAFGVVWRGALRAPGEDGGAIVVKQLKNIEHSQKHQLEFFHETLMMTRFRGSRYLVRLLGVALAPTLSASLLMVQELAPHGDLTACRAALQDVPERGEELKVKLALDLARALRDLHGSDGLRLIHRDVRSPNFFIFSLDAAAATANSTVIHGKLGDFGTVVVSSPNCGERLGNFQYMAPEAFRGSLFVQYTQAIDVYSFAIVAWEIFSCEPPFVDWMKRADEAQRRIVDGSLRPPLHEDIIPPEVAALLSKCWSGNPSDRPTFAAIEEQLLNLLKNK